MRSGNAPVKPNNGRAGKKCAVPNKKREGSEENGTA